MEDEEKKITDQVIRHGDQETQQRTEAITSLNQELFHSLKDRAINTEGFDKLFFDTLSLACANDLVRTKKSF